MSFMAAPSLLGILSSFAANAVASSVFRKKSSPAPAAAPAAAAPAAAAGGGAATALASGPQDVAQREQKLGQRASAGAVSTDDNVAGTLGGAKRRGASRALLG